MTYFLNSVPLGAHRLAPVANTELLIRRSSDPLREIRLFPPNPLIRIPMVIGMLRSFSSKQKFVRLRFIGGVYFCALQSRCERAKRPKQSRDCHAPFSRSQWRIFWILFPWALTVSRPSLTRSSLFVAPATPRTKVIIYVKVSSFPSREARNPSLYRPEEASGQSSILSSP